VHNRFVDNLFFTFFNTHVACSGTNGGISKVEPSNIDLHYQIQIDRYSNCTYVDGNLEITWIRNDSKYDLGFLQHIQEVSGYVLINNVNTKDVILPSLKIIRGQKLLKWIAMDITTYGLLVYDSNINTLQLPALRAIMKGSVLGMLYSNVCHLDTINWNALLSREFSVLF
jgi:epidermal growth factor receptor